MLYSIKIYLFLCFIFIYSGWTQAQGDIIVDSDNGITEIGNKIFILEDETSELSLKDILDDSIQKRFIKSNNMIIGPGITNSTIWGKFQVNVINHEGAILEINSPLLDYVNFFRINNNGEVFTDSTGLLVPFESREIKSNFFSFKIPQGVSICYIELESFNIATPLTIGTEKQMTRKRYDSSIFYGIFIGGILLLSLYHLFLWVSSRAIIYLLFSITSLCIVWTISHVLGFNNMYLWPNTPGINKYHGLILSLLFTRLIFIKTFLQTKTKAPILNKVLNVIIILFIGNGILSLFGVYFYSTLFMIIMNITWPIPVIIASVYVYKKGLDSAKYLIIANLFYIVSLLIYILLTINLVPSFSLASHIHEIGIFIELSIFSLALASQINRYKIEKEQAQQETLLVVTESKNLIETQREKLRQEVQDRTKELTVANTKLALQNDQKQAIIKEIHHRVKNNLQIVNSLLRFQSHEIEDEKILQMFEESQNRVVSMALLHENLYKSENLALIDVKEHISILASDLVKNYSVAKEIKLELKIDSVSIGIKTMVPLGLIINEIITNSLKYAFEGRDRGMIVIQLSQLTKNEYEMIIGDDGIGIENSQKKNKVNKGTHLGTELIKIFVEQLEGTMSRLKQPGTFYSFNFHSIDK